MILRQYKIINRLQETHNVFIWRIVPIEGTVFDYEPGQFIMVHLFDAEGKEWRKNAYSLASSPLNKEYLELAVKVGGEFTQKMAELRESEIIGIDGPYGIFVYDEKKYQDLVMFTGGIGITPFISMIRYATEKQLTNKIFLYYCNQTENDIAYKNILDDLQTKNPNLTILYSVDKCLTTDWRGETGFVEDGKIKKHITDLNNKYFFLCGPLVFMKVVENILKTNQIPSERIKKEVF